MTSIDQHLQNPSQNVVMGILAKEPLKYCTFKQWTKAVKYQLCMYEDMLTIPKAWWEKVKVNAGMELPLKRIKAAGEAVLIDCCMGKKRYNECNIQ